jgi:hypothetical protein
MISIFDCQGNLSPERLARSGALISGVLGLDNACLTGEGVFLVESGVVHVYQHPRKGRNQVRKEKWNYYSSTMRLGKEEFR